MEFEKYVATHGDGLVPFDHITEDGFRLGQWLANQRDAYLAGTIKMDRFRRLSAAGMVWGNRNTVKAERYWNEMYEAARKYAEEHGSIVNLTASYVTEDGRKLGSWISQMRGIRNGTRKHSIELNAERVAMLDAIGMDWEPVVGKHKVAKMAQQRGC